MGDPARLFQVLYALCHAYVVRADPVRAPAVTQELAQLADQLGSAEHRWLAESMAARAAMLFGRYSESRRIDSSFLRLMNR